MRIALYALHAACLQRLLHALTPSLPDDPTVQCAPFASEVTLRRALASESFDLLIVDDTGLGQDALALLRTVRSPALRVILLSARDAADAVADALQAGADDYVVLPFRAVELRARAQRFRPSGRFVERVESGGGWEFWHERTTLVHRGPPEQAFELNPTAFQLALALFRQLGCVVSRPELLEASQQVCTPAALRLLDQQVFKLRRALLLEDKGVRLRSVYGKGYCMTLHRADRDRGLPVPAGGTVRSPAPGTR